MQMSEVLDKLKNLQDVLAEKYDVEAKVEELPKSLVGNTESLDRFRKEFIEKNAEYEAEKAKVAALKNDLEEVERAREAGEKAMDSIETHREYEILEKQISEAQDKENNIRKELQAEEKKLAELDDLLKSSEDFIKATEADVNESKSSIENELTALNQQLEALRSEEEKMSEGIEPEVIFKFQRIIQRNRKGIVAVRGNVCDGCHMILPAQFANEVHRGEKILFCPYCSRILFYEEVEEGSESFFSMDDSGSLADLDDEDLLDDDESLLDSEDSDDLDGSDDVKSLDYEE